MFLVTVEKKLLMFLFGNILCFVTGFIVAVLVYASFPVTPPSASTSKTVARNRARHPLRASLIDHERWAGPLARCTGPLVKALARICC